MNGGEALGKWFSRISDRAGNAASLEGTGALEKDGKRWRYAETAARVSESASDLKLTVTLEAGQARETVIETGLAFSGRLRENFIMVPGAVYDGNRFRMVQKETYSPRMDRNLNGADPKRPDIAMWEIPGLARDAAEGPSEIVRDLSDASTPMLGVYFPATKQALFLAAPVLTSRGRTGFFLRDDLAEGRMEIGFSAPRNRTRSYARYQHLDVIPDFSAGETLELTARRYDFPCGSIAEFYERFFAVREDFMGRAPLKNVMAFSRALDLCLDTFDRYRFLDPPGICVTSRNAIRCHLGWTGTPGDLEVYLLSGDKRLQDKALRSLAFILDTAPAPSGFFRCHGDLTDGQWKWRGDVPCSVIPNVDPRPQLVRTNADMLYWLMKLLFLTREIGVGAECLTPARQTVITNLADALTALYRREGQLGYQIDVERGELTIGGSTAGAMAPGGLALASVFFGKPEYLETAEAIAELYCRHLDAGFTYGGPGDSLFAPDSESAFGLLESLVVLSETTGKRVWIDRSGEAARYASSWTPSYKYPFPKDTLFGEFDIDSTGAVQANLQNQHGAPGLCTLSGDAVFKLFRATGEKAYFTLIQAIAHNITQYIGSPERPLRMKNGNSLPDGDMSEKVYFQDHGECVGELPNFGSGGWPEIACMLTCLELPGLYVQPDTGFVGTIDHVETETLDRAPGRLRLRVTNPFDREIRLKVLAESARDAAKPLGPTGLLAFQTVPLAPRAVATLDVALSADGRATVARHFRGG